MNEPKECLVGHWIRKFMLEHLVTVRNCSPQTRKSYRDAYRKLLPYVAKKCGRSVDALRVADVSRRAQEVAVGKPMEQKHRHG